ncbi:MAG: hypothetical protein V4678_01235 [Patescibacteria group bacterium]
MPTSKKQPVPQQIQFMAGFVIPTIILLTLSDESKLGPLLGMALSLAFPVTVELYALLTGRKQSLISLFAIIGILLIGAISLFGLSEEWLAARRAAIYAIAAFGLIVVARFRPRLIDAGLGRLFDMSVVMAAAHRRQREDELRRTTTMAVYILAFVLLAVAIWSYILTLIVITAPTGSSAFNAEYAQLRILSLPFVTLPLMVATVGLVMYVFSRLERLTGIETEQLLKKKR